MHLVFLFYFIIFSKFLLANSTKSGRENEGQTHNQNSPELHQFHVEPDDEWDALFQDDPQFFDAFSNVLHSNKNAENFAIQHSPIAAKLNQNPSDPLPSSSSTPFPNLHFTNYHQQKELPFHLVADEPNPNPSPFLWPHYFQTEDSNHSSDQYEYAFDANENEENFINFKNPAPKIDGNKENYSNRKAQKAAKNQRIRQGNIIKKMIFLQKLHLEKCTQFPILEEMTKKQHERLPKEIMKNNVMKESQRKILNLTHRCILVMEKWIIEMEKELNERERKQLGKAVESSEPEISIEELILNAKQNQIILKKHPLLFIDEKTEMILSKRGKRMVKEGKMAAMKKHNAKEAKRRERINDELQILLSTLPKEFFISRVRIRNMTRDAILENAIKYIEFLANLLEPNMLNIQQLADAQIGENKAKMGENEKEKGNEARKKQKIQN